MGHCLFFYQSTFFASPTAKPTRWTMLVDNAGLKVCLWGTLNFMVSMIFFSLV